MAENLENLQNTFGEIPEVIQENLKFFQYDKKSDKFICISCGVQIKREVCYKKLTTYNFESHLQEVCGQVPSVISSNSEYLTPKDKDYICNICNKLLVVDPKDLRKTQDSFESHLISKEHLKNSKKSKALAQIPELKKLFDHIPNLILKNIKHFSAIGGNFYCSLCCEIIKCNPEDTFETEHNFKRHILSEEHEQTLVCRRNENNKVFLRLKKLFDIFSEKVVSGLKCLALLGEEIWCSVCEKMIVKSIQMNLSIQIKERITEHFESSMHKNMHEYKVEQSTMAVETLEGKFGTIPKLVQVNIEFINNNQNEFACSLCNKNIDCADWFIRLFLENHLESREHRERKEQLNTQIDFEELYQCSVPMLLVRNRNVIGYDDSKANFYCYLCDDDVIKVVPGTMKGPLTQQNIRNHLQSSSHLSHMKDKASKEFEIREKMASIYGSIPAIALNNLEHLRTYKGNLFCNLCEEYIGKDCLPSVFKKYCNHHLSTENHRRRVQYYDLSKARAKKCLDSVFETWKIPGFLLENLDLLSVSGDDLFCNLCQRTLPVQDSDVVLTKKNLRLHFESEEHLNNVKYVTNN